MDFKASVFGRQWLVRWWGTAAFHVRSVDGLADPVPKPELKQTTDYADLSDVGLPNAPATSKAVIREIRVIRGRMLHTTEIMQQSQFADARLDSRLTTRYLDNNATTPLAAPVALAMAECQRAGYAKAASAHAAVRRARREIDDAREEIGGRAFRCCGRTRGAHQRGERNRTIRRRSIRLLAAG